MNPTPRNDDGTVYTFVSPYLELNAGLWSLFAGAAVFLALRLWVKVTRRHGLWYDDYILIASWLVLLANNIIIVYQFATGYVLKDSTQSWDDRMHILINISSCGTLIGQAWTKTAFGVTLLRMTNRWQRWILWFCIITMNLYMVLKVIFQWAKVCNKASYQNWYRLDFCIGWNFRDRFKEGGNVYNIIMDFVFAIFPWLITRSLEMRRVEKIGLCVIMSLGMIVAIVSAIRVSWKDNGNERDEYYIWRNGMSMIWYSSEIAGTIIVQCIPILRPILRDIHTSLTSRRLGSTSKGPGTVWTSMPSRKHASTGVSNVNDLADNNTDKMELRATSEESTQSWNEGHPSSPLSDEVKCATQALPRSDSRALPRSESLSWKSFDAKQNTRSHSSVGFDVEQGLSPPPRKHISS